MNIPLNEGYRLSSDKYQWIVQKQITRKGKIEWKNVSYHATPKQAVNHHAGVLVRTSEADTLTEALAVVERVVNELTIALHHDIDVNIEE